MGEEEEKRKGSKEGRDEGKKKGRREGRGMMEDTHTHTHTYTHARTHTQEMEGIKQWLMSVTVVLFFLCVCVHVIMHAGVSSADDQFVRSSA